MGAKATPLMRGLQRFRRRISARYEIDRMILFGSHARGEAHRHSDVDLIIVSRSFGRRNAVDRAYPLRLTWDMNYPVDLLCYTPEEFRALSRRGGLVREALKEGVEVPE